MTNSLTSNEYTVLARKYRPQRFEDLIGQNVLVQTLSNAIINQRVAHAYLLTGVRGIGKTTLEKIHTLSKDKSCSYINILSKADELSVGKKQKKALLSHQH